MCNQVCAHCHVDAGPDRQEIMTKKTMQECLTAIKNNPSLTAVDVTGGAPEMNPGFRWFIEEIKKLDKHVIVRKFALLPSLLPIKNIIIFLNFLNNIISNCFFIAIL